MEMGSNQPQPVCLGGADTILNLHPESSVAVSYHPLFGPHDDLILLELDEKLIPDVLNHKVSLRGATDEDAVLCTQSKTYAVKYVGTSNSVLLVPPSDQSLFCENTQNHCEKYNDKNFTTPIMKVSPGVMEIVEVAPRLDKLKTLLSKNPYRFDEMLVEDEWDRTVRKNTGLYRWYDLIENIQASDDELRSGLEAISAVEIEGYWRIVDEDYMTRILKMLLHNSILHDWSFSELNESEVIDVLQSDGYPYVLARHCLRVFGSKLSDEGIWRLNEKKICVQFAREILRGGKMKMENFMVELMRKVPEGMQTCFDTLEGEVVTEKIGIETLVYAFSVSSLPSTPAERFSMLFKERSKWEWKDLQPYIRDLCVPGLSAEGLLLKYTRRTQPTADAEPVFSAR